MGACGHTLAAQLGPIEARLDRVKKPTQPVGIDHALILTAQQPDRLTAFAQLRLRIAEGTHNEQSTN